MIAVTLDRPAEEYLADKVASGEYSSPDEVILAALRMLKEHDAWLEEEDRLLDEAEASPTISNEDFKAYFRDYFARREAEDAAAGR